MILVTAHRCESFGDGFTRIRKVLARVAACGDVDVIYPVHPNPNVRGPVDELLGSVPRIHLVGRTGSSLSRTSSSTTLPNTIGDHKCTIPTATAKHLNKFCRHSPHQFSPTAAAVRRNRHSAFGRRPNECDGKRDAGYVYPASFDHLTASPA